MPDAPAATHIPMRQILFATDFLESSRLALDYAVAFSHHYGALLTITHAFELSTAAEEAELFAQKASLSRELALKRLLAFAEGLQRQNVPTEIDLRGGDPAVAILKAAQEKHADLLVLGTHGIYRGLQHTLLGSNAEKVLLSAPCPTLTVGRHVLAGVGLDLRFKEILFVSDFSEDSLAAARYAAVLSRDLGIDAVLVPLRHPSPAGDPSPQSAIESFCAALAADPGFSQPHWCDPAYHLQLAVPPNEIIQRSEQCLESLLVTGVHPASRLDRHLHASFAYELVARSSCPLLTISSEPRS